MSLLLPSLGIYVQLSVYYFVKHEKIVRMRFYTSTHEFAKFRAVTLFWHGPYTRIARQACSRRDEVTARARAPAAQVYLVSSFILLQIGLQGDSRVQARRFIEPPARRFASDASYAIGRDWPCANLAYRSRTHSTRLASRRTPMKQMRERRRDEIHVREKHEEVVEKVVEEEEKEDR